MRIVRGRGVDFDGDQLPSSDDAEDRRDPGTRSVSTDHGPRSTPPRSTRDRTRATLDRVAETREPVLRIWRPVRQVTFGRRDARSDGFETAKRLARRKGFPPVERRVGGRAVAHTGGTVAFALAVPTTGIRADITDRYDRVGRLLTTTFRDLGAAVERGEPPNAYCPGSHSIRVVDGGKVAGIAQRVRRDVALVSGCLTVRRRDVAATIDVLDPVYDALGVPFDPEAVGCLADAGGPSSPSRAAAAIATALSMRPWHVPDQ